MSYRLCIPVPPPPAPSNPPRVLQYNGLSAYGPARQLGLFVDKRRAIADGAEFYFEIRYEDPLRRGEFNTAFVAAMNREALIAIRDHITAQLSA